MSVSDNFNYNLKTNCRKDLMSLNTLNDNDFPIRPFKKMNTKRDWSINLYNKDIEYSYPSKMNSFVNKVDFINKVDDIDRTNPKVIHWPLNKPNYNLSNEDIEKTKPNITQFHTPRITNPLQPVYTLSKVETIPLTPLKFLRDNIDISDIKGTKPRKICKFQQRETFPLDNGIKGSKAKKTYVRKTKYNNIDYSDLTKDIFKTRRHVNPLDPVYEIKYKNGENYCYGLIEKSKPEVWYPYKYDHPNALKINDIKGTEPGSKNKINVFNGNDYNLRNDDIPGTKAGSLKKGISTLRNTNPLTPKYQWGSDIQYKTIDNINNNLNNNTNKRNVISAKPILSNNKEITTPVVPIVTYTPSASSKDFNQIVQTPVINNEPSKTTYNFHKPKPFYGLVHDKYVCSTDNVNVRNQLEKKKEDYLVFRKTHNIYQDSNGNNNNPAANANLHSFSSITNDSYVNGKRSCVSALGPRSLSNAQKLDKFLQNRNLNYIGENINSNNNIKIN